MKRMKKGFTLIEIALFLAVTGLLFVGIMVGTQNSIWQQRYNDSIQSFANFIRNVYSEVSNPQSLGDGRSDLAIYGRLITFGQTKELDGETDIVGQKVFVYDVVGKADDIIEGGGSLIPILKSLDANVVTIKTEDDESKQATLVGIVDTYIPIWSALINDTDSTSDDPKLFNGSILIVRHPKSGTINTLYYDGVIDINKEIKEANDIKDEEKMRKILLNHLNDGGFELKNVDFCVNPYGYGKGGALIRDIRIIKNARNSSGVEIIDSNDSEDKCKKG